MKLYLVWKVSISGWNKEIVAIFKNKENALRFNSELQSNDQYYFEINEGTTKD